MLYIFTKHFYVPSFYPLKNFPTIKVDMIPVSRILIREAEEETQGKRVMEPKVINSKCTSLVLAVTLLIEFFRHLLPFPGWHTSGGYHGLPQTMLPNGVFIVTGVNPASPSRVSPALLILPGLI